MRLQRSISCDVLVLGSGIAGISAALTAAESGSSVILACKGKLFSGSSFYPGTWGLGLIGPADQDDIENLAATIQEVGCNMTDPEMVRTFVSNIPLAIARVRDMGVKLRRADKGTQKEYIPCFDYKHRDWNGIEFDSAREVFGKRLEELKVQIMSECEVLELVKDNDRVCGAIAAYENEFVYIGCGAVVLATGGYGSIFKYHLCTEDVLGIGQHMALQAGASLVNMEFMQMMPGYVTPAYKTVFNEKTFRYTHLRKKDGTDLLNEEEKKALQVRAPHGPFTTRLESKVVDIALFNAFMQDESGVEAFYSDEMLKEPPEFVQVYFDWLLESKGVRMSDHIHIGIFAHAANGGIKIRPDASTEVAGLYAAGEVTGGMHGADRIGGLSTANGLVFGTIAGGSAARYATEAGTAPEAYEFELLAAGDLDRKLKELQQVMFENAMVLRSEAGISKALCTIEQLRQEVRNNMIQSTDVLEVCRTQRFLARCTTAESVLRAALLRTESRGSHYRTDYPSRNDDLQRQIQVRMDEEGIHADFIKDV